MGVFDQARYFNLRLGVACSLIALSSFNYGFDNQGFSSTQSMDAFARRFGVRDPQTGAYELEPSWLAQFNSLIYVGFAAGVIIGSLISKRFGRRWCVFCMSLYALVSATIAVTSTTREQIMAARILNYMYVGMELSVVPTFQSEIVPAPARGLVVGTYQLSLTLGGLVINCVCRGTSALPDDRAWRIPLALFYVVPAIVGSAIWFLPESPRWLLLRGRDAEARAALRSLRAGRFSEDEIEAELHELRLALALEAAAAEGEERAGFAELWRGGVNLKRTLIVLGVNFFQQATGQSFASSYGAIYVKSLGALNQFNFLLIQAGINVVSLVVALLCVDKFGRRSMLMLSSAWMGSGLIVMGSLGVPQPVSHGMKIGIISMLAFMITGFSVGWGPLTYVVSTEVPSARLRDLTVRSGFFTNVVTSFVVSFSIPYLIYDEYAGLGSKVGFIFGAIALGAIVFVYFLVPECKGKTLEQVDLMFQQGVSMRVFGKTDGEQFLRTVEAAADIKLGPKDGEVATHVV
ncbi:general substrate transporter [Xylariaceae sp. FL0804]|nr:general substrate transporter [Xylariaceae sp. FL0804]